MFVGGRLGGGFGAHDVGQLGDGSAGIRMAGRVLREGRYLKAALNIRMRLLRDLNHRTYF